MLLFPKKEKNNIESPCDGQLISLEEVHDEMFSKKMLGDGCAFVLQKKIISSPVNGVITAVFPTKHAIGITTKDGVEILLHIGLDTVDLQGKGFHQYVGMGDRVKIGDYLIAVDIPFLQESNIDSTLILIITNSDRFFISDRRENGNVYTGDVIFKIKESKNA